MEKAVSKTVLKSWDEWQGLIRRFKEKLAERLWALPTVTETEKEMVFKEYLSDLGELEQALASFTEEAIVQQKVLKDENELLRSLMGVSTDELKTQALALATDKNHLEREKAELEEELEELRRRTAEADEENTFLRKRLAEFEKQAEQFRLRQVRERQEDIRYFADTHEKLKIEMKDLETRLGNLRELFVDNNKQLVTQKQAEISILQKKLLEEMEAALRRKQEVSWGEEELFAKGVAHRVRTALVSAQGQLMLTLERLGLMDPETKTEAFWKARLKLLVEGADALSENFRAIQAQLHDVISALDDYFHLTNRREISRASVSLKEIVQAQMADLYASRRPTLSVELMAEDPCPDVTGDSSLLSFTVRTLFQNALEALPNESGQILISLKNRIDSKVLSLTVRDSGAGIPEHLQSRLFQPFFTTKESRQGLSLCRAKRYAELHGGSLELIQTSPEGTQFELRLPIGEKI